MKFYKLWETLASDKKIESPNKHNTKGWLSPEGVFYDICDYTKFPDPRPTT